MRLINRIIISTAWFWSVLPVCIADIDTVGNLIGEESPGKILFEQHCGGCHDGGYAKAPITSNLRLLTTQAIYRIQTEGAMRNKAAHLKDREKQLIAEYLSGKKLHDQSTSRSPKKCKQQGTSWFDYGKPPALRGWGFDRENRRFIPGKISRLSLAEVKNLRLKWAFSYPESLRARSQPAVAGGALYVGSHSGMVYALDARTGCQYWSFQAAGEVRTAIVVEPWKGRQRTIPEQAPSLYFGDVFGSAYALNAVTGGVLWKVNVDHHPAATITGAPVYYKHRLFVPISAMGNFSVGCCTNRGAIVALDARNGDMYWKTTTIPAPATVQYRNAEGDPWYGPGGASVMNSPTIDERRGLLYFGTGQNHGYPTDNNSDAIFALNIDDGRVVWKTQVTARDSWPVLPGQPQSDRDVHLDYDFSASPILIHANDDKDILVAGQKSGKIFGFNPDNGAIVWRKKVGRGGAMGGVHFGMAVERHVVFVPIHDNDTWVTSLDPTPAGVAKPGLYALDAFTGELLWSAPVTKQCPKRKHCLGYSAAITAIPGIVFAATRDGQLYAFDSKSGDSIWSYDTTQTFTALNGETTTGGDIAGPGPVIVDGMVYVNSGYGAYGGVPGNVLLAFVPSANLHISGINSNGK